MVLGGVGREEVLCDQERYGRRFMEAKGANGGHYRSEREGVVLGFPARGARDWNMPIVHSSSDLGDGRGTGGERRRKVSC